MPCVKKDCPCGGNIKGLILATKILTDGNVNSSCCIFDSEEMSIVWDDDTITEKQNTAMCYLLRTLMAAIKHREKNYLFTRREGGDETHTLSYVMVSENMCVFSFVTLL